MPVRVVDFNDQETVEAALIENIQRADLNPVEKAHGFKDYLDRFKMTHEQLASRLGLGRTTVTNLVALLDLPPEVQDAVRVGQLSTGHAKLLKGVEDRERVYERVRDSFEIGTEAEREPRHVSAGRLVGQDARVRREPLRRG